MTIVVDASVVVAALIDGGPVGNWAESILIDHHLAAPYIMPAEVASILRRAELAGDISMETASLAHSDLLDLSVDLFPYDPFATRVWDLRLNLTAYDAWYVGLAETLEANLATLDSRLAQARGPRCRFVLPDR